MESWLQKKLKDKKNMAALHPAVGEFSWITSISA